MAEYKYKLNGDKIRALRNSKGLTRKCLAKLLASSDAFFHKIESKETCKLTLAMGLHLAEILEVDPYELVLPTQEPISREEIARLQQLILDAANETPLETSLESLNNYVWVKCHKLKNDWPVFALGKFDDYLKKFLTHAWAARQTKFVNLENITMQNIKDFKKDT